MKRVKVLVASVLFCAMGYTGYTAHERMTTTGLFSGKICSTIGKGSYCGGDPCSNGDGNCR